MITATATQGRFGNGQGVEYSEAYMLEYWRPKLGKWVRYRNFRGEEVRFRARSTLVAQAEARRVVAPGDGL